MTRTIIAALAALSIALGLTVWVQAGRLEALREDVTILAAARDAAQDSHRRAEAVILSRDKRLQQLQRKQAQRQKDLDRVLKDNRDWADQPVPPDVAEWLRKRTDADAPGAPAGAPAGLPAP